MKRTLLTAVALAAVTTSANADFLLLASAIQDDGVTVYDTDTGAVVTEYGVPVGVPSIFGLEWNGRYLISEQQGRDLWSVDEAFINPLLHFSLPDVDPWGIVLGGGQLYVNGQSSTGVDTLYCVNESTGEVINRFAMPDSIDNLRDLAYDGTNLWGVDSSHRQIFRINPTTGVFDLVYDLPGTSGFAIAYDPALMRLWYVDVTGSVYRINPADGTWETAFNVSGMIARAGLIRDSVVPILDASWGRVKSIFREP